MSNIATAMLFENLGYSLLWVICCAFCIWFHSIPEAGHKRDLSAGAVFFASRAVSTFCSLWDRIHGTNSTGALAHWVSGVMAYSMILYIVTSYGDVVVTILRSEKIQRLLLKTEQGHESLNIMLPYASRANREHAEGILARWEARLKVH